MAACLWGSWKARRASVSLGQSVLGAAGWSSGVGLLGVALEGQAALCWGRCVLGMLRRRWPGGWSLWGKEGAFIPRESLVPQDLNRHVP